jgi:hypothetical protein
VSSERNKFAAVPYAYRLQLIAFEITAFLLRVKALGWSELRRKWPKLVQGVTALRWLDLN